MQKINFILHLFFFGFIAARAHQLDIEYAKDFTDLIELVYGDQLLSQGGADSIELLFAGCDLSQKKVLDIGSGLGGVDFYLAERFDLEVIGLDCVQRLVDEANVRKMRQSLRGSVSFIYQDPENMRYPFEDNTFDIIFSKEAFLHIPDKGAVLKELRRVLKPGGKLIILDWLIESHNLGTLITEMMEVDGLDLKMATLHEYKQYCEQAGLSMSKECVLNDYYVQYTADNITTIYRKEAELVHLLGQEKYAYCLKTWALQKQIFENREVVVTLLNIYKPLLS